LFNTLTEQIGYVETEQDWEYFVGAQDKTIRRMAAEVDIETLHDEPRQSTTLRKSMSSSQMFNSSFTQSGVNSPFRHAGNGSSTPLRMDQGALFNDFNDVSFVSEFPNMSVASHSGSPMRGLASSGGSFFGSRNDLLSLGAVSIGSGGGAVAPATPNRASLIVPRQNSKARFSKLLATPNSSVKFRGDVVSAADQSAMITDQLNEYNQKLLETLGAVRQSIVDEQALIMYELCRVFTTECTKPMDGEKDIDFMEHTNHLVKRSKWLSGHHNINAPHTAPPTSAILLSVIPGDIFTAVPLWSNTVEDLVIRLSTLLSDWLHTHLLPLPASTTGLSITTDYVHPVRQLISAMASPVRRPRPKTPKSVRLRKPNKPSISNQDEVNARQKEIVRESLPSAFKYGEDHRRSRFATQEILLFTNSHLLKEIALDSYKVYHSVSSSFCTWPLFSSCYCVRCVGPRSFGNRAEVVLAEHNEYVERYLSSATLVHQAHGPARHRRACGR
jgi:hypothetical protein